LLSAVRATTSARTADLREQTPRHEGPVTRGAEAPRSLKGAAGCETALTRRLRASVQSVSESLCSVRQTQHRRRDLAVPGARHRAAARTCRRVTGRANERTCWYARWRMEREMETLQCDLKSVESRYGEDVLQLLIASGYLSNWFGMLKPSTTSGSIIPRSFPSSARSSPRRRSIR
jgi:hypothetical protein